MKRFVKMLKKIQTCTSVLTAVESKMRNKLQQSGTTWNKMWPTKNPVLTPGPLQTHTHTETKIVGGYCVQYYCPTEYNITRCVFRTQWNICDGALMMIYGWTTLMSQHPLKNDHKRQQICQIRHEKCQVVRPVFQVCLFYTS